MACSDPMTPESRPNSKLAMETKQHIARHFQFAKRDDVVSFASAILSQLNLRDR